ncbi:MAG: DUF5698 domain-containing protein [Spirochaetaceae bacterium]|jgi:uncharacterized protein YebE (UPF0316 family)|nr:DUF5698 domain-containing protein [Spirochaetaceae bacterium]
MLQVIIKFFTAASVVELILILISKVVEVSLGTVRQILINKGYRREGTILSFFEIILWTFVASRVIMGIAEAPVKGIVYSIGFSLGVYLGSRIENHIALGKVLIQTIISKENSEVMVDFLRSRGYAVTTMEARGRDSEKTVLMIFANRKGKEEIIREIHNTDGTAMIITNDISTLHGGHISASGRLIK